MEVIGLPELLLEDISGLKEGRYYELKVHVCECFVTGVQKFLLYRVVALKTCELYVNGLL